MSINDRHEGEIERVRQAVAAVWAAADLESVKRALARNNSKYPMVSVRFFRAAIRWKFPVPCDPRVISRILFDCVASIPDDYQYLLAPREAEAFIRAELNGEVDLIAEVPIDYDPALGMMQVLTWHVFGEAVVNPPALAELQLIASTVAAEHRTLASLTGMKLDKVFVGRNFSPADFDSLLAEADMGGWS